MTAEESEECLARALVGRLGTVGADGWPYVVPMNFVYDPSSRTVFLHCATSGHRLDNLAFSPSACFEVDEPGNVVTYGADVCETSQPYTSVICFGQARIVSDDMDRKNALHLFVQKYIDDLMPGREYDMEFKTLDSTAVVALRVEIMTGKKRPTP